jgi:hypothetical protein
MTSRKFPYDGRSRPSDAKYKENFDRIFNPTLVKNMPNVKWKEIPPVKGPDPQGVKSGSTVSKKRFNLIFLYFLASQILLLLLLLLYLL